MDPNNLSLYRIFFEVASTGNISRAAKNLYISQPAISKAIQRLEQNMGFPLFIRSSRGVILSQDGEVLYEHVKRAFSILSEGEKELRQIHEFGIGYIRIGVSTTLCKYILLPYLAEFVKNHPHMRISIECQSSGQTLRLLEENRIDIGLIGQPFESKNINFHQLMEIHDVFVASRSYIDNLLLREPSIQNNLLNKANVMLLDKSNMTRKYIDEYVKDFQTEINHAIEVTSMDLLIDFAKIGLGIGCVIQEFVQKELAEGDLILIKEAPLIKSRYVGFAYAKKSPVSSAIQNFIDFIYKQTF